MDFIIGGAYQGKARDKLFAAGPGIRDQFAVCPVELTHGTAGIDDNLRRVNGGLGGGDLFFRDGAESPAFYDLTGQSGGNGIIYVVFKKDTGGEGNSRLLKSTVEGDFYLVPIFGI